MTMPAKRIPLDSVRYGRLTVLGPVTGAWLCRCDCGTETVVTGSRLRSGNTRSCGCALPPRHGYSASRVYAIWNSMVQRCENPGCKDYPSYGGRGIRVCERWL